MVRANWYTEHPPACTCTYCQERRTIHQAQGRRIGRNERCPCGSGKKYKRGHGK